MITLSRCLPIKKNFAGIITLISVADQKPMIPKKPVLDQVAPMFHQSQDSLLHSTQSSKYATLPPHFATTGFSLSRPRNPAPPPPLHRVPQQTQQLPVSRVSSSCISRAGANQ